MSNIPEKTFAILDLVSKIKSDERSEVEYFEERRGDAGLANERQIERCVVRVEGRDASLEIIKRYLGTETKNYVATEQSLIDWLTRKTDDNSTDRNFQQKLSAWKDQHACVGARFSLVVPGGQILKATFKQSFAGIDAHDFVTVVLEHTRSKNDTQTPINRDPGVLLLVWRSILVALRETHRLGLVHGDAYDDNFCLVIHDHWDHRTKSFTNLPAFNAKAIDLGCIILPQGERLERERLFFRGDRECNLPPDSDEYKILKKRGAMLSADYQAAFNGDDAAYGRIGCAIDFLSLAKSIAEKNHLFGIRNPGVAKNLGVLPQRLDSATYDVSVALKCLLELPLQMTELSVTSNSGNGYPVDDHNDLIASIDDVLGIVDGRLPMLNFGMPKIESANSPQESFNIQLEPESVPPIIAPEPIAQPHLVEPQHKPAWTVPTVIAGLIGVSLLTWSLGSKVSTPEASTSTGGKAEATTATAQPTRQPQAGIVSESDPLFTACTKKSTLEALQSLINRHPANLAPNEQSAIGKAIKACEGLLTRTEPAQGTHLVAMSVAAYYALVTGEVNQAQSLLAPALAVSGSEFSKELERVYMAEAAIRAVLGQEQALYSALEKAAIYGQSRQNLDDDCPLHRPYQASEQYQQLRAKFKPNGIKPAKPLASPAC